MRRLVPIVVAAGLALAGACSKDQPAAGGSAKAVAAEQAAAEQAAAAKVGEVSVDQLDQLIAKGECQAIDANNASTRARAGVIPGATLLTSYSDYDLSVLPTDKGKKLVFYCANEMCGASHAAAERAVIAGYTDVGVMPAGIAGWAKAGKPVRTL
ncbi:MAG: rhodanese-like domain-containing protein [Kofleriaceae bacterium]|nr:rhodanese-like domain-containing protein [Myxococcales bacterium]MCB9563438.1 rhodanese-like domain-containing protein [Kofleriaceae bacterium]MCB9574306.1 rhodanese-like domain-containing protein [Kofleriaceae bacterium]